MHNGLSTEAEGLLTKVQATGGHSLGPKQLEGTGHQKSRSANPQAIKNRRYLAGEPRGHHGQNIYYAQPRPG